MKNIQKQLLFGGGGGDLKLRGEISPLKGLKKTLCMRDIVVESHIATCTDHKLAVHIS